MKTVGSLDWRSLLTPSEKNLVRTCARSCWKTHLFDKISAIDCCDDLLTHHFNANVRHSAALDLASVLVRYWCDNQIEEPLSVFQDGEPGVSEWGYF